MLEKTSSTQLLIANVNPEDDDAITHCTAAWQDLLTITKNRIE